MAPQQRRSGLSDDTALYVGPRVAVRGIGGVTRRVLSQGLIVPSGWFGCIRRLGNLVPKLFHEQKFLGRGQTADLGGEGGVHGGTLGGRGGVGNSGGLRNEEASDE